MMLHIHVGDIISLYAQNAWSHNIADGVFTDPPVSHFIVLCMGGSKTKTALYLP